MKYLYVNKSLSFLIFTISIIYFPPLAAATIVRTEMVFYDLATANYGSYALHMHSTATGAQVTLHRQDNEFSLSTNVVACFNKQASTNLEGYLWLKERNISHADPTLSPFLNFTEDNRLRVAKKPLANAQSVLLDKDSLTVLVVDPTMMTLGAAGCQH